MASVKGEFGGRPHGGKNFGTGTTDLGNWTITFKEADNDKAAPSVVVTANGQQPMTWG